MKTKIIPLILLFLMPYLYAQDNNVAGMHVIIDDGSTQGREAFVPFSTIRSGEVDSVSIDSPESVTMWTGIRLCELIKTQLQVDCQDIVKLTISADDGYSSVISDDLLRSVHDGLCAFQLTDSSPWEISYGYMRIIFPDLRRMYWVNSPTKMIITLGKKKTTHESLIFRFLDNKNFQSIMKQDLTGVDYFAFEDLVFTLQTKTNNFTVVTGDSLIRDYHVSDELNKRLLFHHSDDDGWEIDGIDVPLGLKTRHISAIIIGGNHIFTKRLSEQEQNMWATLYLDRVIEKNEIQTSGIIHMILTDYNNKLCHENIDWIDGLNFYELIESKFQQNESLDYIEWMIY
ncbi:hypothetical protein JXB12_03560 [candidate division KSB1 bacterium]|nr:hypothetical protein [candidate division KSB1 bacterium]